MTDNQKWKYECEIAKLKDELREAKKNERAAQKGAKLNAEVCKIQAKKIWGLMEENAGLKQTLSSAEGWLSVIGCECRSGSICARCIALAVCRGELERFKK